MLAKILIQTAFQGKLNSWQTVTTSERKMLLVKLSIAFVTCEQAVKESLSKQKHRHYISR